VDGGLGNRCGLPEIMPPLNIALLHYSAPPIVGGVEAILGAHARLMSAAGHSVRVIAGRGEQGKEGQFVRIPLADSRHPRVLAVKAELDRGHIPDSFAALRDEIGAQLDSALREVDVLITHNVCSLHKNLALTAAIQQLTRTSTSLRLILWHHDLAWSTPRYRRELHDGLPWDLLRTDWGGLHVVVSEPRRRELAELLRLSVDSITVVPNGVDATALLGLQETTVGLSTHLGLWNAAPLLLTPVRITRRKNLELALQTLASLKQDLSDAKLVITGPPGPHNPTNVAYLRSLRRLRQQLGLEASAVFLADHYPGHLPHIVVADLYRMADALLLPSREEGFGIPLIEAALTRLPIFCADIPPLRELAGEEATYFHPDAKPDDVAELIAEHFRHDPQARLALRARSVYSWDAIYRLHLEPLLEA